MLGETVRMALQVLVRSPVRSGLTVLGLAIGVAAFIAMVTFGEGARRSVLSQFEAMGTHVVFVTSRSSRTIVANTPTKPLTDDDVTALRREADSVALAIPLARTQADFTARGRTARFDVTGTTPDYFRMMGWPAAAGGVFDRVDLSMRAKVCVLGQTAATALFDDADPLGEVVHAGDVACRVVGVLERRGMSVAGNDQDALVAVPATTFADHFARIPGYWRILVRPRTPGLVEVAREEAVAVLRRSHEIPSGAPDDFLVESPDDAIRTADGVARTLAGLLAGIAAVSLLVGGIGIANILLVSVSERTREIGVRAALGASPRRILSQFLAEALALSLVGSSLGAILGAGSAVTVAAAMRWPQTLSPTTVLASAAFGIGTGVVFGYLPARRAARMDPVEALRRE